MHAGYPQRLWDRATAGGPDRPPRQRLAKQGCGERKVIYGKGLLADEGLRRSRAQMGHGRGKFRGHTLDRAFSVNYDIFIRAARTILGQYGKGSGLWWRQGEA